MFSCHEGRQTAVRPGKPSYRTAFQSLAENKVFAAQNEIAINNNAIAAAQATVKSSSEEVSWSAGRQLPHTSDLAESLHLVFLSSST